MDIRIKLFLQAMESLAAANMAVKSLIHEDDIHITFQSQYNRPTFSAAFVDYAAPGATFRTDGKKIWLRSKDEKCKDFDELVGLLCKRLNLQFEAGE